jgi:hypothetical protein
MAADRAKIETVKELAEKLTRLREISQEEGFDMLAYLLKMAIEEARDLERRHNAMQ